MSRKALIRVLIIMAGMGCVFGSVFAFRLGFDNDPGWGTGRSYLLSFGLAIFLFGASYWLMPMIGKGCENISRRLMDNAFMAGVEKLVGKIRTQIRGVAHSASAASRLSGIRNSGAYGWFSRHRSDVGLVLLSCCVIWTYAWVITIGRFEKWPSGKDYYWQLSQAFLHGQTHLLVEPSPDLLSLENPYDYQQRKGISYLWDVSLYDGKYYLYWGPAPAVFGAIFSSITSKPATDSGLVFVFVTGAALISLLLLRDIYSKHRISAWLFWGGALSSAVNVPLIWLLTRPKFYEVSVAGGQFFLMAGFFLLFRAFFSPFPRKNYLVFSAISFGLAGATRINLLPSVTLLAMVIAWRIYVVHRGETRRLLSALAATFIPLALIAGFLFLYNYGRFGSIFEFGHRYQLTSPALSANYGNTLSMEYITPNLYTYVFRPPSLSREFPFLTIPWITTKMWPLFIRLPRGYYYTEPVAGILFVVPIVGMTVLLFARFLWMLINGDAPLKMDTKNPDNGLFLWFGFSILGYVVIQTLVLLVFVSSAVRYLLDITPALLILCVIFTAYYARTVEKGSWQRVVSFVWIMASLLTALSGFLIGFTGDKNNFLNQNPQLYYQLFEWFSR
jgi:hypothetical protein